MDDRGCTYNHEGLLDWSLVAHWSEELVAERQNHQLLEETVSVEELLGGSGDVSVVVENSHSVVTGDLGLDGDVVAEIEVHLSGCHLENTSSGTGGESLGEALVSNLIDHDLFNNYTN